MLQLRISLFFALTGQLLLTASLKAASPSAPQVCENWRIPELLDPNWTNGGFVTACVAHERCYATPGASWGACNLQYQLDLSAACKKDFKTKNNLQKNANDPERSPGVSEQFGDDSPTLALCLDIVEQFVAKVQRASALKRFQRAQGRNASDSAHNQLQ